MTREEYDTKKLAILEQKRALDKELDDLRNSYASEELGEYIEKYEGKYVLYYERELRKAGNGPIIPEKYTIYKIEKVKYVGHGFIDIEGIAYTIEKYNNKVKLAQRIHDEFRRDIHLSTWREPDAFLTYNQFMEKISEVAFTFDKMCASIGIKK